MNQYSSTDSSISHPDADTIARRAYELWEKEGRPDGSDLRHWLQAEQELSGNQSRNESRSESDSSTPRNTGTDLRPLQGTRAAAAMNRDSKYGSAAPFNSPKNNPGDGTRQSAGTRRPSSAPPS